MKKPAKPPKQLWVTMNDTGVIWEADTRRPEPCPYLTVHRYALVTPKRKKARRG